VFQLIPVSDIMPVSELEKKADIRIRMPKAINRVVILALFKLGVLIVKMMHDKRMSLAVKNALVRT
jgi:hypothetical protein